MAPTTDLLEAREGRTQTDVLAAIATAEHAEGTRPRQVDLVERLPISKGVVSNTCKKLIDAGLVRKTDSRRYELEEAALRALYREHVDMHLARESASARFDSEVEASNDTRTATKRELRPLFAENNLVFDIVLTALMSAEGDGRLQTIRDVVHRADHLVRSASYNIVTHPSFDGTEDEHWETLRPLLQLGVVLERVHSDLDVLGDRVPAVAQYLPGNTPAATMTTYFTNSR